jgi:hypothetical protein
MECDQAVVQAPNELPLFCLHPLNQICLPKTQIQCGRRLLVGCLLLFQPRNAEQKLHVPHKGNFVHRNFMVVCLALAVLCAHFHHKIARQTPC